MKRRFLGQQRLRQIGNDILDPECRMPVVLVDGVTVRFPAHWTDKAHRDMWREAWTREEYLKARGKG